MICCECMPRSVVLFVFFQTITLKGLLKYVCVQLEWSQSHRTNSRRTFQFTMKTSQPCLAPTIRTRHWARMKANQSVLPEFDLSYTSKRDCLNSMSLCCRMGIKMLRLSSAASIALLLSHVSALCCHFRAWILQARAARVQMDPSFPVTRHHQHRITTSRRKGSRCCLMVRVFSNIHRCISNYSKKLNMTVE